MATEIGVLADDLTGALGSAARLRRGGLEPVVVWRAEDLPDAFRPRAVVVDMRTRDAPRGPRATAAAWAARLRGLECARFEQRIDSTLRGAPADELAGLLEGAGLEDALVVAVPAWPDAGRVCVGGRQRARGTGREVEVAPALFRDSRAEVVRPERLSERVRAGAARRFVVDGERDEDLRASAEAVAALEEPVVTASPGGWLRYHPLAVRAGGEFVLVVVSSNTALNHRQLAALRTARRIATVPAAATSPGAPANAAAAAPPGAPANAAAAAPPGAPANAAAAAPPGARRITPAADGLPADTLVVETITDSQPDDTRRDPRHADGAAAAAAALLADAHERGLRCRGVVASGGHLASLLVDALGAQRLAVSGEVAPLCARGTVAGGPWSGLRVVTKGGLVGEDDTLTTLVEDLWKEDAWDGRRSP